MFAKLLARDADETLDSSYYLRRILEIDEEDDIVASTIIHDSIRGTLEMRLEDAIATCPSHLNALDERGLAPLHWAIIMDNLEAVHSLMRHGAAIDIRSGPSKMAPLHYAASTYFTTAAITVLLKYGAHVDARDSMGQTALHLATYNVEKVRILLNAGATPNSTNNNGESPLYGCIRRRYANEKVLAELLRAGADVNLGDRAGNPPLMMAVLVSSAGIASFLIEMGAAV
ncbi:ankyrin repeat-containing domain protein, partial [Podospora appendiculata]